LKSTKIYFLLVFYVIVTICSGSLLNAQISQELKRKLQEKVPVWLSENNVPAAGIGIIENGKIDWTAKKIKQKPVINLPDDVLEKYVGTYVRLDNNSEILVVKGEGSILKMSGETVPPLNLLPSDENMFFAKGFPVQFEFVKNESGTVIKMNVIGNGKVVCETRRKNEN
jgi:hypothetical protein